MPFDDRYDQLSEATWSAFADSWLAEIADQGCTEFEFSKKVTLMKFLARPEHLWNFIVLSIEKTQTNFELGRIGVDLLERLLGNFGPDFIDRVEAHASSDPAFAIALSVVAKHTITEDVWHRVQATQSKTYANIDTTDHRATVIDLEKHHLQNLKLALEERRTD